MIKYKVEFIVDTVYPELRTAYVDVDESIPEEELEVEILEAVKALDYVLIDTERCDSGNALEDSENVTCITKVEDE